MQFAGTEHRAAFAPFFQRFRAPLLLLAILIVSNFNIIFLGQSLVATANSNPVSDDPRALRPGLFHGGSPSVNWHDLGGAWWQWEPAGKLMSRAFRIGRIPLWDSEVGGGVDSHVNMIQTQYYPPYMAVLLAGDTPLVRDIYYLAQLYASGLFCYLLLLRNGCSWISSVGMGAAYMLSGSMTQNVNSSIGQSFAVLPLMLWATDWVVHRNTWRAAGLCAFLLALAASSSFLPAVISGYVLAGIYVAVACGRPSLIWARGRKTLVALVLSIFMLSFLLIPVELASRQDQTFSRWYAGLGLQHYSLDQMLALVSPSVSFDVDQLATPSAQLFAAPPTPSPFYCGLIPILLAIVAFGKLDPRFHRLRAYFGIAAALLFLKLVGAVPAQWIALLPVFRELHFIPYFGGALTFAVAGLAGLGMEGLIAQRSRLTFAITCLALISIALCIVRFDQTEALSTTLQGPALWSAVARYGMEVGRLAILAVSFLTIIVFRFRKLNGTAAGLLLLTLVSLDLISLGFHERFLRADVWDRPPDFVRFLQADRSKFRVQGTGAMSLAADVSQAVGVDVLSSRMAFNSSRYSEVLRAYFHAPALPYPLADSIMPSSRVLLDLLNVKYLVLFAADPGQIQQISQAGLVPVFKKGDYTVYGNPQVWSRAYLASAIRTETNPQTELAALSTLQPGDVLLEERPLAVPNGSYGTVQNLHYDFDRITAHVHTTQPGLLVLEENYASGWRATVGNQPARIYRANYTFQAVTVPSGDSEVDFSYTPPGLLAGIGVSLTAAILAALLCVAPRTGSREVV